MGYVVTLDTLTGSATEAGVEDEVPAGWAWNPGGPDMETFGDPGFTGPREFHVRLPLGRVRQFTIG